MKNHSLKQRVFSEKEISLICLTHLDDDYYNPAVIKCEVAIESATTVRTIYLVPAIAGTIDQLASLPPRFSNIPNTTRPRHDAHIRAFMDYVTDDSIPSDDYSESIEKSGETPFIRLFRRGGG